MLLRLSEVGHYQQVSELFKFPVQNCPDMLVLALLQITVCIYVLLATYKSFQCNVTVQFKQYFYLPNKMYDIKKAFIYMVLESLGLILK